MRKVRVEIHEITKLEDVGISVKAGIDLFSFVIFKFLKAVLLFVIGVMVTAFKSLEQILEIRRELFEDMDEIFRRVHVIEAIEADPYTTLKGDTLCFIDSLSMSDLYVEGLEVCCILSWL
ncbi:MAG: hypothetical protein QW374_02615 [Candidatus Bathyarchaeia archaeon]|nr:hypothetical protein [Candidatus Bathyarchaeota archaeon]